MSGICLTAGASDWRGLIGVQREVQGSDVGVGLHSSVSEIVGRVFYSANFTEWLRVWWDVGLGLGLGLGSRKGWGRTLSVVVSDVSLLFCLAPSPGRTVPHLLGGRLIKLTGQKWSKGCSQALISYAN